MPRMPSHLAQKELRVIPISARCFIYAYAPRLVSAYMIEIRVLGVSIQCFTVHGTGASQTLSSSCNGCFDLRPAAEKTGNMFLPSSENASIAAL